MEYGVYGLSGTLDGDGEGTHCVTNSATKEFELLDYGAPPEIFTKADTASRLKQLTQSLHAAIQPAVAAINDNAPFYPANIRNAANKLNSAAPDVWKKQCEALFAFVKGGDITENIDYWKAI